MKKYNVNDIFNFLDDIRATEYELQELNLRFKNAINNLNIEDCKKQSYESIRDLLKSIQYQITDKSLLNQLSEIVYEKKVQKYPELLKPTYYPEIDTFDISNEEKLYLDKVCKHWYASYIRTFVRNGIVSLGIKEEYALKKLCFYSTEHLEMLEHIGIVEKYYRFLCKFCYENTGCFISETELNKHKKVWELYDIRKNKTLSVEELEELDDLECSGYGVICIECEDECESYYEIDNLNDFDKCLKNNYIDIFYKVVKKPNLTYEKL